MPSLAEKLRREDRERLGRIPLDERLETALEMGQLAVEAFADAEGLSVVEARKELERRTQMSRSRPSRCVLESLK